MFNVGDKVVYPMHGAGTIDAIEERSLLNEKQSYYVIKMPGEVKVMIPTSKVDEIGVGSLMEKAIYNARIIKKKMPIGVCGEQAGDPKSIEFFNKIGVSYVSCSPYRVAIARLASAQAAIRNKNN